MRVKSWRIPTWLIVVWTLIFGLLVVGDLMSEGSPEGLACVWGYCSAVSVWGWAIGAVPLGLLWYATRSGVPRVRVGLAVLVAVVVLWALLANRQWAVDAPPLALAIALGRA